MVGTHGVKEAARRGELHAAVLARDATENARDRVLPLLRATGVPIATCESAGALGAAVGRGRIVVAGVTDPGFAGRVLAGLPAARTERD